MEPRISFVTLGVRDLERAARFYAEVLRLPRRSSSSGLAIFEMGLTWLALCRRDQLAAAAGVAPAGSGFPGFMLTHNVPSAAGVDALLAEVARGGGQIVKPAGPAEWGGYAGTFADPDGFLWEVTWNPRFPHV